MPAKSVKQQRFFGMVRAAQKGEGAASPEVAKAASSISKKDAKDFASTKHKGLPMKKENHDFETWVESLVEEGYDLSDFTWEEMYDIYEGEGSYGQTPKAREAMGKLAIARRDKPASEYSQKGEKTKKVKAIEKHTRRIDNGPNVGNRGKRSTSPRWSGGRGKMDQDARDYARADSAEYGSGTHGSGTVTKNPKKLRKQKAIGEIGEGYIREEDYDRMKDRRMERGGVDGNTRYPSKSSGGGAKKPRKDVGMSALELVKSQIRAKHGDKAIYEPKKKANEGYAPGDIDQKVGAVTAIPKSERDAARERLLKKAAEKRAAMKKEESEFAGNYEGPLYAPHPDLVQERGDFWHPDPEKDRKLGGPGANQRAREDRAAAAKPKKDYSKSLKPGESYMDFHKRKQAERGMRKEGKTYSQFVLEAKGEY